MKEFKYVFQIGKKISFEVRYSTVGSNKSPDFATSANELNRNNSDFDRCGQAQKDLLPEKSAAGKFFAKWDNCHLKKLQDDKVEELKADIEVLKQYYNYIEKHADSFGTAHYRANPDFRFSEIVELCKQTTKAAINSNKKRQERYQYRVLDKRKNGKYNEYLVENIKTNEKGVFDSNWVKEQVSKNIVTNMSMSNNSLYFVNDKLKDLA